MKRGLTQISNIVAAGLFGNNSDLSASVLVSNNQVLAISGKWFNPGTATVLLDGSSLGTAQIDTTGSFSTAITIPVVAAGKHVITVQDSNAPLIFTLTRLPTVAADYTDSWHTQDFTINLTPDFPLTQICYRINNGAINYVSANGQPKIITESSNNTLEYWGLWDVYGTGSLELKHSTLTGIKLDKTVPVAQVTSDGYTRTPAVTLSLIASYDTSGVSKMRFSNDNITWSSWEPFASSKTWTLVGSEGQKTVYVQLMDVANLVSQYSMNITLQTTVPTPTSTPTPVPTDTPTSSPTPTPNLPSDESTQSTPNPTPTTATSTSTPQPTPANIPELNTIATVFFMALTLIACLVTKRKLKTTPTTNYARRSTPHSFQ